MTTTEPPAGLPAPEGVEVVHADGTVTPCTTEYRELRDGAHVWAVVGARLTAGDQLRVALLPGHTGLTVEHDIDWEPVSWPAPPRA